MKKDELIEKFESGKASRHEVEQIEQLILAGEIDPMQFSHVSESYEWLEGLKFPDPGVKLEEGFYARLAREKRSQGNKSWLPSVSLDFLKSGWGLAAYSITLLLISFFIFNYNRNDNAQLVEELREMKEVMMLSMIEEESSTDRLKAVSMSTGMTSASDKVIEALFETLNNDENDNVRLAALEALLNYTDRPSVRTGLVESIATQESPMLQISLAEVMMALQEKSSVEKLNDILEQEDTPEEVKVRVRETIESLI